MNSPDIKVRCAVGLPSVSLVETGWRSLAGESKSVHPSVPLPVIRAAATHRVTPATPLLVFLAERDALAVAAMVCTSEKLPWAMGARQLRGLGDQEVYSVPLLVRSSVEDAAELLRTALNTPPGFRRICLEQQTNRSFFERIQEIAPDLILDIRPGGQGSFLPIPQDEDVFWRHLSFNFRRNLKKQKRRLSEAGSYQWRFLRGRECTTDDFEKFFELEASGWKGQVGGAILTRPQALSYYRQMLRELAEEGHLELHFLELNGRYVAAQVGVHLNDVLSLLKIAYDESCARLAPGNMLLLELVKRLVTRGDTSEVNCLTDMTWHHNWAMQQREYVDVTVYPRTLGAVAMAYAPRALKHWLRENPYARSAREFVRSTARSCTPDVRRDETP